jgi:hypothetical protein
VRGAEAVRAGVAAADDDDVLAGGVIWSSTSRSPSCDPVGLRQELHRLVDARRARGRAPAGRADGGADGEHDRVVALAQVVGR